MTGPFRSVDFRSSTVADSKKKGMDAIESLDLRMVKMKLCLAVEQEGKGWTREEADHVEKWYKRFLKLQLLGYEKIVPTKAIDEMWHAHLQDTLAYHRDCAAIFGEYLHHFPYFGLRGERDAQNLQDAFEKSCSLFMEHFGESPMDAMKHAGESCETPASSCQGGGTGGGGGCSRNDHANASCGSRCNKCSSCGSCYGGAEEVVSSIGYDGVAAANEP